MRILRLLAVAALSASAASGTVLTFSPGTACGATACTSGAFISQAYGDTPFVDISYTSLASFGNSAAVQSSLHYGSAGYGDLSGIAYAGTAVSDIMEIKFTPLTGASLELTSFDIGGSPSTDRTTNVRIYDLNYNLLLDYPTLAPGDGHNAQNFISYDFPDGFIVQLGLDGFNVGIDNITYQAVGYVDPVEGVPEPTTWFIMIAGFGLIGGELRRRRLDDASQRLARQAHG